MSPLSRVEELNARFVCSEGPTHSLLQFFHFNTLTFNAQPLILILEEGFWRGCLLFNSNTKLMKKWPRQAREDLLLGFGENPNTLFLASMRACERRGGTSSFGLALYSILSGLSYAAPPASPAQPGTPCLAAPTALPSLAHPAFAGL